MNTINSVLSSLIFIICTTPLIATPVITSLSLSNGDISGGNVITISGSGFIGSTAADFGFRAAVSFVVITDNSISALVPLGRSGSFDVDLRDASQSSSVTSADLYTYTENSFDGIISYINQDAITRFDTETNSINSLIPLPADSLTAIITSDGTTTYLSDADIVDVIKWRAPTIPNILPVAYRIYCDAFLNDLIDVVPSMGVPKFEDHYRQKHKKYTYYIVSVNEIGTI